MIHELVTGFLRLAADIAHFCAARVKWLQLQTTLNGEHNNLVFYSLYLTRILHRFYISCETVINALSLFTDTVVLI